MGKPSLEHRCREAYSLWCTLVRIGGGLDKVETDTPVKSRDHTDHSEYGVGAGLHGRARGGSSTGPTGPSLNWMLNGMNGVELAREVAISRSAHLGLYGRCPGVASIRKRISDYR